MRPSDRRDHLRSALVEAAERAIAAHGLAGLKARDLAQEVGCAVGAIYTVFPDLDALVLAVNVRTLALIEAAVAATPRPAGRGEGAAEDLVRLSLSYLDFAAGNGPRWRALFEHRMAGGAPPPDWYLAEQVRLFRYIEEPLRALRPDLDSAGTMLLARSVFSATHGMVSLGLDEKLMSLPREVLRAQLETLVGALARGLLMPREDAGSPPVIPGPGSGARDP